MASFRTTLARSGPGAIASAASQGEGSPSVVGEAGARCVGGKEWSAPRSGAPKGSCSNAPCRTRPSRVAGKAHFRREQEVALDRKPEVSAYAGKLGERDVAHFREAQTYSVV